MGFHLKIFHLSNLIIKTWVNIGLNGQITLVNFFATWCKPCRDEHSFIQKFLDEKDLKIIGINYKDDSKKTKQWLKKLGNPYSTIAVDKFGKIAIDWGVYGIPETFIVNSNGIIKYRHVGPINKKIYKKMSLIVESIKWWLIKKK